MYISTDKTALDIEQIFRFLNERSTWAKGIHREVVIKSIENSLCFGLFNDEEEQVGFCRMITDYATFANLVDVYILEECRGLGYSKFLLDKVMCHPELQGLRRITLATADAHGLYQQFGFTPLNFPTTFMEILNAKVYQS